MDVNDVRASLREGQLETILATFPAAVLITDRDGRVVSANSRVAELWGGTPPPTPDVDAYAVFKGWWPKTGEPLDARDWAPVRALLNGETVEGEMVDIERFDGGRATILNSAAPLLDSNGTITGAVAVMQDVSEQRERQRTNELLLAALSALSGSLDLGDVLDRLVHVLIQAGPHTRASVMLWDEQSRELELVAAVGDKARPGVRIPLERFSSAMREAVENKRMVTADFSAIPAEEQRLGRGIASTLIVPLMRSERLLGVATVDEMRPGVAFTERDIAIVEGIAAPAALAIENARLYEAEHHVATTLQQALLAMPEHVDGVAFAHAYRSASEEAFVGGDFYDLFEIEGDLIGVLVGDIAGKGLEAAVLTQLVKNTVQAHAVEKRTASAATLEITNNIFYQVTGTEAFVTLFFGVLDRRTGRLDYTNAGHTTAFILRENGQTAELPADSPLLGAFADRPFEQSQTWLAPGDIIVAYTDGITEARAGSRQYGETRLLRLVSGLHGKPPALVVQEVMADVLGFSGGALNDDLAILAVERLSEASSSPRAARMEVGAHA